MHRTVEEVLELPASEIFGWKEYFNVYPFTQDREDARTAMLAQTVSNMIGYLLQQYAGKKSFVSTAKIEDFLPDFLNNTVSLKTKSLAQQEQADRAFGAKLLEMQARARGN